MRRVLTATLILFLSSSVAAARGGRGPFPLKFIPQEGVETTSLDFEPAFLERSVEIRVEDGRRIADPSIVGQGTDDDDRKFPIKTETDVVAYVTETTRAVGEEWGLKTSSPADRLLTIKVTRFFVDESNKALGSIYQAEVKLAFSLQDAAGKTIDDGIASGDATRYGRSASTENYNEVLSDALKDAFANVLSDPGLQAAWSSGQASGPSSSGTAAPEGNQPQQTPEERLEKLKDLLEKKVITKEEYEKKRAEILKEL